MIKSFKSKEAEQLFERTPQKKPLKGINKATLRKLLMLDAATQLKDLSVPMGNRLEKLSGKRKGQHSIRINDQWRICFKWKNGDAYNVEIVDYH